MKEIKYNGNLEEDIKAVSKDEVETQKFSSNVFKILSLVCTSLVVFVVIGSNVPVLIGSLICVGTVTIFGYLNNIVSKIMKENVNTTNGRLHELNLQLKDNDIVLSKLEIEKKVEINNERKIYRDKDNDEVQRTYQAIVKYLSFLDTNKKIQILKYVKTLIIDEKLNKEDNRYYLLEEEDKKNLDKSLKKTLKIDK